MRYNEEFPEEAILESWDYLLERVGDRWNILGLDLKVDSSYWALVLERGTLKNEPHGAATWGFGNATTDWNKAAERIAKHIAAQHPNFKVRPVPSSFSHVVGHTMQGPLLRQWGRRARGQSQPSGPQRPALVGREPRRSLSPIMFHGP